MTLRQDLAVTQGQTWSHVYTHLGPDGLPVDLTGYSARMAIKAGFESTYEAYLSSGPDANGGTITLGDDGKVTLAMTAKQSAALAGDLSFFLFVQPEARAEQYVKFLYDLELEAPDGTVTRPIEGRLVLQREVTS